MVVVLDSTPLGQATNPKQTEENVACQQWIAHLLEKGVRVVIPEIAAYEVRRELIRSSRIGGIARLDYAKTTLEYLPITTDAMLLASELWAKARREGYPTASDKALDGDVILIAQALTSRVPESDIIAATANVSHLSNFITAKEWQDIAV